MKLLDYISKIPLPKLVHLIGSDVIKGLQEFNLANKPLEMAEILYQLQGYNIFRSSELLTSLMWTLTEKDLEIINQLFENKKIEDFEIYRDDLLTKKWGKNQFSRAFLKFFNIQDDSYVKTEIYNDVDSELIIPRLSTNEIDFMGQKIFIPEMYPLHNFQKATKDKMVEELLIPGSKFILHMPTGSGKTKTAVEAIIDFWRVKGKRSGFIVWFAHSRELCNQGYETFKNSWQAKGDYPLQMFKIFGDNTPDIRGVENGILFIGFQKFTSIMNKRHHTGLRLRDYTRLIIVDEAHKSVASTYKKSIEYLLSPDTRLMGLTATPGRSDSADHLSTLQLSSFYNNNKIPICNELGNEMLDSIKYLQDNNFLARLHRIKIDSDIDFNLEETPKILSSASEENYDLPKSILSKLSTDNLRNSKIILEIEKAVLERRDPTLIFSTSIAHAVILKILLQKKKIQSECVLSTTPTVLRSKYINDFKNNKLLVLINYQVLTTGFDAPNIRTLVISRPTTSIVLYSQMLGRALRGPLMGGESSENTLVDIIDNYGSMGTERAAFNYFDGYYS